MLVFPWDLVTHFANTQLVVFSADAGMFTAQWANIRLLGRTSSLCLCRSGQRPTAPFCTSENQKYNIFENWWEIPSVLGLTFDVFVHKILQFSEFMLLSLLRWDNGLGGWNWTLTNSHFKSVSSELKGSDSLRDYLNSATQLSVPDCSRLHYHIGLAAPLILVS